jgi:hypothetical protein|tara:strand:+ start:3377 stop:3571 length:195 start_codon:yes stop_codon:yes gene_type:complete
MGKKKRKIRQPIKEVEIVNRRTKEIRKVCLNKKEIIIYNDELNEFQLLPVQSSSYDGNSETNNE